MTSRTKLGLPALAMTLAAAGIRAVEKFKGQSETSRLCVLAIDGVDRGPAAAVLHGWTFSGKKRGRSIIFSEIFSWFC